jgi:hypothetical protein
MKSWILLVVLAVGLTTAATVAVPLLTADATGNGAGFPAPSPGSGVLTGVAEVEGDLSHKFGVMAWDSEGQHSWVFRNTGRGPLELRNGGTDCSCTVAQLGKPGAPGDKTPASLVVKPGASEPIDVKWNTRRGDGPYRKTAKIDTNDPTRPVILLTVEGIVKPAITIIPGDPAINFQTVSNDEPFKRMIGLFSSDRPDFKLTRLESSNPGLIGMDSRPLSAPEAKVIHCEKGYALEVTLKMGSTLGAFAEEVVIQTDHPMKKEIRIPVLGRVTGPITSTPEKVLVRDATSSNGGGQDLTLWVRGRTSARFTVATKPEALDVGFEPIPQPAGSKGSKYKMTVRVIPGTPAGKIDGEIVLKSDHPQATEVRVPVDVLVLGSN